MNKLLYLLLLIPTFNFGQDFQWAYNTREVSTIYGTIIWSIVTDSQGNVYATGSFGGTFDFDDSDDDSLLTPVTSSSDGFVLKLDKNKNFQWVKQLKSLGSGRGRSIILDQNENLIITGITSGQIIDLDPHPTNQFIINNPTGNTGSYIIKLDQNGEFLNGSFYPNYFAKESVVDINNNIITTGNIGSSNSLNNKIFIIKSDSNCILLWEKLILGNNIFPHSLVCDNSNNIILKGNFMYNMIFSNITYTSSMYSDFICKLGNNGQDIWYQKLGNTASAGASLEDKSIKIDNQNNIFFSTRYNDQSSIILNGQNIDLPHVFAVESVLFKITQDGNHIWNVPIYGNERQEVYSIALNNNNEIIVLMFASGQSFILNNSNQIFPTNTSSNSQGGIIVKINSSGSFIGSKEIPYNGYSLFTDYEDNILTGGSFTGQQDFDPSPTNQYLMNSFRGSGFILKLGFCDSSQPDGSNNQIFCSTQNPTISNLLPNSSSIKWYESLTSTVQLSNSTSLVNGLTYYASNQNGSCPESTRLATTVTINQTPDSPIVSNQTFCENENAILSNLLITGQNIKFYDSLTNGNVLPNSTLLDNTNYYVSQTVNGCESTRTIINTTITPSPTPLVISPQSFCIQQNATISDIVITGQYIKWYDSETGGNLLSSSTILVDGVTYYASQTLNSCESSRIPITIQIHETSAPIGNNQSFCTIQNPTLNDITINGSSIKWYSDNTSTAELAQTNSLTDNTTYYATQTLNGCESTTRLPITIGLISTLNANDYSTIICDSGNNGTETTNLTSFNSYLLTSIQDNTFTYYQSLNGAKNQTASEQLSNNHSLQLGVNTIFVRIDSSNGCHQIVELQLTLVNVPQIPIQDEVTLCETGIVSVNAGPGFNSYTWSTNATTQSIVLNQAGNYWVTVTKNHNSTVCSSTKNFAVVLSNQPTITSINTIDWTDFENSITVNVTGLGNYEYSIDGINFQESPVFSGLSNGVYIVTVKDTKECGIATKQVYLLNYPKFFTPNGDGNNDTWKVKFSQFEENFVTQIFDRYGKLIKVLNNHESWDGTYNGKQLPSDDYWFQIIRNDGRVHKGHFAMLR